MSDDMDTLGKAWRESDLGHAELLASARRARRRGRWFFGLTTLVLGLTLAVCAGYFVTAIFALKLLLGGLALACGWMMLQVREQQSRLDAADLATPLDGVRFLLDYYRARLRWRVGRGPVVIAAIFLIVTGGLFLRNGFALRETDVATWYVALGAAMTCALLAVFCVLLGCLDVWLLRRNIARLDALAAELSDDSPIDAPEEVARPIGGNRRRTVIAALIATAVVVAMTILAIVVRPWATHLLETGTELSMPTQVVIATAMFWRRNGVYIAFALAVAIGAWHYLSRGPSSSSR
jgi:hypothetical protein